MDGNKRRVKPYEGTDPYIFISYSHRDYDRIEPILRELAARGYRFWYDEGIDPGTEWPESIARHLENSSVCLSFISPGSAASTNCRREINFALSKNIPLLSVFLEDTEISPGLEMQISTYQSIMAYTYPDLASLMERIVSVDVTEPCRGAGGTSAAAGGGYGHTTPAVPKKRLFLSVLAAALILAAAAAAVLLWPKKGIQQTANAAGTPEPAIGSSAETAASAPSQPVPTPGPIPEGYSVMLHGKWEDGTVLLCGDGDKNIRIELTDGRIPYGYPMSEQPGNSEPVWNVVITFGEGYSLLFDIRANHPDTSFRNLHTDKMLTMFQDRKNLGGFRYALIGNTFCFDTVIPEDFTAKDIDSVNVFLGTESSDMSEYFFFLDG